MKSAIAAAVLFVGLMAGSAYAQFGPNSLTFQGTIALTAGTSTPLIAANVTMSPGSAALPAAGKFQWLTVIAPGSSCNFTINWQGGTATATSGEQMGTGTMVGSDRVYLGGNATAPTLYSASGCASPNLIQFHN